MTSPREKKPRIDVDDDELQQNLSVSFKLENIFEDVANIFKPNRVERASSNNVLIAVDTNVLLLPYTIRKDGLPKLQKFYADLRSANRLFLPARVAREFIVHRDKKLAELIKKISDVKSKVSIGETEISPIIDGVEVGEELREANRSLAAARKRYMSALGHIESTVRSWAGDDPVSHVYETVFSKENIISTTQSREEIYLEWETRLRDRIPPGYKDGEKSDKGIGDFLIWKSLLALGAERKMDLIFVTGDEKADWYVRVNGGGAYPRPELISEYRKHSGGKNLRLAGLHEVLREMDLPETFTEEIETAEIRSSRAEDIVLPDYELVGKSALAKLFLEKIKKENSGRKDVRFPLASLMGLDPLDDYSKFKNVSENLETISHEIEDLSERLANFSENADDIAETVIRTEEAKALHIGLLRQREILRNRLRHKTESNRWNY